MLSNSITLRAFLSNGADLILGIAYFVLCSSQQEAVGNLTDGERKVGSPQIAEHWSTRICWCLLTTADKLSPSAQMHARALLRTPKAAFVQKRLLSVDSTRNNAHTMSWRVLQDLHMYPLMSSNKHASPAYFLSFAGSPSTHIAPRPACEARPLGRTKKSQCRSSGRHKCCDQFFLWLQRGVCGLQPTATAALQAK